MATLDSLGIFDRGPEAVQQLLDQQAQASHMAKAQLAPGGAQKLLASQAGGMLGDLFLNKGENPEITKAKKAQEIKQQIMSSGLDPSSPEFYKNAANLLNAGGFIKEAMSAAQQGQALESQINKSKKMSMSSVTGGGTLPLLQKYINARDTSNNPKDKESYQLIIDKLSKVNLRSNIDYLKEQGYDEEEALDLAMKNVSAQVDPNTGEVISVNRRKQAGVSPQQGGAPIPQFSLKEMQAIQADMANSGNPPTQLANPPFPNGPAPAFGSGQMYNAPTPQVPGANDMRQAPKLRSQLTNEEQKAEVEEIYKPALAAARTAQTTLDEAKRNRILLKQVDTGPLMEIKSKIQNLSREFGINLGDPTDKQAVIAAVFKRNWEILNTAKGVQTEGDAERALKSAINLTNTKDANQFLNDWEESIAQRSREHIKFLDAARSKGESYRSAELAWQEKLDNDSIWNMPAMKKWEDSFIAKISKLKDSQGNSPIDRLKANPELANDFEQKFGIPARRFLGQ